MPLNDGDLGLVPRRADDRVVLHWIGDQEIERFGREFREGAWSMLWDRRRRQAFWIVVGGEVVGEIELIDIRRGDRTAELRIGIAHAELLGRGLGSRAIRLILSYAVDHLHLATVYLRVREANRRAVRCYEKCGFRKRGRLQGGRFREAILLMECELASWAEGALQGLASVAVAEAAVGEGPAHLGQFGR